MMPFFLSRVINAFTNQQQQKFNFFKCHQIAQKHAFIILTTKKTYKIYPILDYKHQIIARNSTEFFFAFKNCKIMAIVLTRDEMAQQVKQSTHKIQRERFYIDDYELVHCFLEFQRHQKKVHCLFSDETELFFLFTHKHKTVLMKKRTCQP